MRKKYRLLKTLCFTIFIYITKCHHKNLEIGEVKMEHFKKVLVQELIYEESKEAILQKLDGIDDPEVLHIFAYNYNWDNGFAIPKKILEKKMCELATALMIFYAADGIRYLENRKNDSKDLKEWNVFMNELYKKIIHKKFIKGKIKFVPPLNRVYLYKLKQNLKENEMIFIEVLGEIELDIVV